MTSRNQFAAWVANKKSEAAARDARVVAFVLETGTLGISAESASVHVDVHLETLRKTLRRLMREGRIERGSLWGDGWRWGAPGIAAICKQRADDNTRARKAAMARGKRARVKAARASGDDDAELDAWARESIRRIVPATDAKPIRPARPMSIFHLGAAA